MINVTEIAPDVYRISLFVVAFIGLVLVKKAKPPLLIFGVIDTAGAAPPVNITGLKINHHHFLCDGLSAGNELVEVDTTFAL